MTKKVIAIISVLKPVDDTRNFEKIARSLSNTNKYDINIIGFSTINIPSCPNITFHPVFNFKRTSINRLRVPIIVYKKLLKLKPELIIVTTPELLIVSLLYKILFGAKIIYDIQENYYRNMVYTSSYPALLKYPIALSVRTIELVSSLFIDKFILAEKVYLGQMKYLSSKAEIIENRALIPDFVKNMEPSKNKNLVFVYSGTIAEHYGIFDAIDFIINLKAAIGHINFIIIGYAAKNKIYKRLQRVTEHLDYIKIIGGDRLVPHDQVLMELQRADFCLLPYQINKSTEGCIPTKLFECLAMEKPVIISSNPAWNSIVLKNNAGIIHDFKEESHTFQHKLYAKYYGNHMSSHYIWENSSDKLLATVQRVL
ncbi:MAG: glycosyltransferase [Cyclobacteriaceae bacterium]|nr:glycosyltransferase [Cyclobacteriaceae bacterium]